MTLSVQVNGESVSGLGFAQTLKKVGGAGRPVELTFLRYEEPETKPAVDSSATTAAPTSTPSPTASDDAQLKAQQQQRRRPPPPPPTFQSNSTVEQFKVDEVEAAQQQLRQVDSDLQKLEKEELSLPAEAVTERRRVLQEQRTRLERQIADVTSSMTPEQKSRVLNTEAPTAPNNATTSRLYPNVDSASQLSKKLSALAEQRITAPDNLLSPIQQMQLQREYQVEVEAVYGTTSPQKLQDVVRRTTENIAQLQRDGNVKEAAELQMLKEGLLTLLGTTDQLRDDSPIENETEVSSVDQPVTVPSNLASVAAVDDVMDNTTPKTPEELQAANDQENLYRMRLQMLREQLFEVERQITEAVAEGRFSDARELGENRTQVKQELREALTSGDRQPLSNLNKRRNLNNQTDEEDEDSDADVDEDIHVMRRELANIDTLIRSAKKAADETELQTLEERRNRLIRKLVQTSALIEEEEKEEGRR